MSSSEVRKVVTLMKCKVYQDKETDVCFKVVKDGVELNDSFELLKEIDIDEIRPVYVIEHQLGSTVDNMSLATVTQEFDDIIDFVYNTSNSLLTSISSYRVEVLSYISGSFDEVALFEIYPFILAPSYTLTFKGCTISNYAQIINTYNKAVCIANAISRNFSE